MVGKERKNPELWDSMLTQGALRQRRRRALESADERKERLARDAERKRIKRMRESAEEAAWRRTVDAMRKKEKRMKEKIEKLEGQYTTNSTVKVEVDLVGSNPVMGIARMYSRKRRIKRPDVSEYTLFTDDTDITDFGDGGGGYDLSNSLLEARLKGMHDPIPGTSAGLRKGSLCYGPGISGCSLTNISACVRPAITGAAPGLSRGRLRRSPVVGNPLYCSRTDMLCVPSVPPGVTIEKVKLSSCQDRVEMKLIANQPDDNLSALSPEVIISEVKLESTDNEEECDIGGSQGLSNLSPEVLIRGKSEALEEDEDGDIGQSQHISALSPEVIISEMKPLALEDDENASGIGSSQDSWCSSMECDDMGCISKDGLGGHMSSCISSCSGSLKHSATRKMHHVAIKKQHGLLPS